MKRILFSVAFLSVCAFNAMAVEPYFYVTYSSSNVCGAGSVASVTLRIYTPDGDLYLQRNPQLNASGNPQSGQDTVEMNTSAAQEFLEKCVISPVERKPVQLSKEILKVKDCSDLERLRESFGGVVDTDDPTCYSLQPYMLSE